MNDKTRLNRRDVQRRFDRAAETFDGADFVHAVTRQGLLERLQPLVVDATAVLDLGAATGGATRALKKRFGRAHIISFDLSHNMLQRCASKRGWWSRAAEVQGDATRLPFADNSFDVVFANLLLPWTDEPAAVFKEVARVLRRGGVFAFATLGPDSLLQLARAWANVDGDRHVHHFLDMHDVGDAVLRAGLSDPVLDVDRLAVQFSDAQKLFRDLTDMGARNSLEQRRRSLLGKDRFAQMRAALEQSADDGPVEIDVELVYGHCWGTEAAAPSADYRIDAAKISTRRRQGGKPG